MEVAKALKDLVALATDVNSAGNWAKLFFPYVALKVPKKEDRVSNLTKWVKSPIGVFLADPNSAETESHVFGRKFSTSMTTGKKIEVKLPDGDVRGAIRLLHQ